MRTTTHYLNHAGTSWPKPQSVLDAVDLVSKAEPDQWPELFRLSFETIASFFHVDSSRLVLTPGCTSALNLAILDQAWNSGDRVFTSSFEHHALYRNLVQLRSRHIEIIEVPPATNSTFDLDFFRKELKKGSTTLVAITAACNVTGALLPIEDIIDLTHQYDAKVLIDGAQIAGWSDLNLNELGVDFFTFAGHKGPQSPWGIGGLYVSENSAMSCPNASCEFSQGKKKDFETKPGYCDAGSVDLVALAGLAAGCRWLSEGEQKNRLSKARMLAKEFTGYIREHSGCKILHDFEFDQKMPTVAISFDNLNQSVAKKLKEHQIFVSSGFQCAPLAHQTLGTAEHGVIRFSFGPSQKTPDFGSIARIIAECFPD